MAGRPRFLINFTNKILLIPVFRIGWPLSATINSILFIPFLQNLFEYYSNRGKLDEYIETFKEGRQNDFDKNYDVHLRKIFYEERNLFILFCLIMLIFIFVKFSGVYVRMFAAEDELAELKSLKGKDFKSPDEKKEILQNNELKEKPVVEKKTD